MAHLVCSLSTSFISQAPARLALSTEKLLHEQSIFIIVFANSSYLKYFLFTKCSQTPHFFVPQDNLKMLVEQ